MSLDFLAAISCRWCDQVGVHYDPMIAKVIAKGPDRQTALTRLHTALSQLQVSSQPFHDITKPIDQVLLVHRGSYAASGMCGHVLHVAKD